MPIDVRLPLLGLTMTEGTIQQWLKRVGEPVALDEPLFVVETDKAAQEVLSPADGVLGEILAAEGDTVPVEDVVARLLAPGEALATSSGGAPPSVAANLR